ncbi:MAG: GFA family protein [Syntrophotaleaceae bacterium]
MKKTYKGSCHCGNVRFEADIDLDKGTFKCNCSICTKTRNWLSMAKPEDFRLLEGEGDLADYQFGAKNIHHLFCRNCGVHPFGWGIIPDLGGKVYAVNVTCLDDLDVKELVNAPVTYVDGRNDNFASSPDEVRHL